MRLDNLEDYMKTRTVIGALAVACAVLFTMAPLALAQGVTGTVNGTVKDSQGGVIPGATVTLVSESQGTKSAPVISNERGDFVFPNLTADSYTVQVEMPSFKTAKRSKVAVSPGTNLRLDAIVLEIGGTSEIVEVTSEGPAQLQTLTGEKSYTIEPKQAEALPVANRSYVSLIALVPGVALDEASLTSQLETGAGGASRPTSRIGGGGFDNYMVDGLTTMSSGINRPTARISAESISEVKVATFGYGAEYGRSSGNQINAVTKSGTNQFHGSLYDLERHSKFGYANSKVNILNGDPKSTGDQRDWGWSIGGPIGKPGGNNKLFFFWNQEYNPRVTGNAVTRYRMPTLLERQGDFSQTTDNNGLPYPYIKDPNIAGTCSAANTTACFKDGGVLGKIPANRIWSTGANILKWWPAPNCPGACTNYQSNAAYNYETTYPSVNLLGWEPIVRVDYAPTQKLRINFKTAEYMQPNKVIPGRIPGFSDSTQDAFAVYSWSSVVNYTVNSTTFMEGSFGWQAHHQEGCSITGGDPNWCITGDATNPSANRITAGFGGIPYLFPDATLLDHDTVAYRVMQSLGSKTTVWDGQRVQAAPSFSWGNRVANAPLNWNLPWSSFILEDRNKTGNFSFTKVTGQHTIKAGYQYAHLVQTRGTGAITGSISFQNDTANPLDSQFGFANALLGVFSSYSQVSRWGEGAHTGINHEFFLQDNWKVNQRLTLDYGLRFVHEVPTYDGYIHFSNFFPEKYSKSGAPRLYTYGCDTGVYPCTGAARRAMDPGTGAFVGTSAQASLIVGTLVPGTGITTNGAPTNGLIPAGTQGLPKTGVLYPKLGYAPRVGGAYTINQNFVVRGAAGLFIDRPSGGSTYSVVNNPPFSQNVTVRYGFLQDIATSGLATQSAPSLSVFRYENKLPISIQWNGGLQTRLPFSSSLDLTYTGQHSYNEQVSQNINTIDYGAAYLAANQDRSQTTNGVATSIVNTNPSALRSFLGYGSISQNQPIGWHTFHSVQLAFSRRLQNGLSFGFNDTMSLYDVSSVNPRLQHNPDGTLSIRSDQDAAQKLLGDNHPQTHVMRANVIWQLPKLTSQAAGMKALGYLVNDWSVASIWSGSTGASYNVGYNYTSNGANIDITGSPDFGGRAVVVGDPGSGCSNDPLKAFNAGAFKGPSANSVGLDSGSGYLRYCFQSKADVSLSRSIKIGEKGHAISLRLDTYNAFNQAAVTGRVTNATFASPATNTVITNSPYDANGNVVTSFSKPRGAGFGVANSFQTPRTMQVQLRYQF
jgi:hypothetical protein